MAAPRILLVDDEPEILDGYCQVLAHDRSSNSASGLENVESELFGTAKLPEEAPLFDVSVCRQGEAAVAAVQAANAAGRPFAVAFLDVRMPPGMDGVKAAERIRTSIQTSTSSSSPGTRIRIQRKSCAGCHRSTS